MPSSGSTGDSGALTRFRRLVGVTAFATFALIVIGGVVRVSDSGLGCGPAGSGVHGWPLCTGKLFPLVGGTTMVEFTHRLVAGLVAILIILLAILAWRTLRDRRRLVAGSTGSAILVLLQAGLGGLTVEHNLHAVLVAVHLGVAMVLLAILLWMYRDATPGFRPEPEATRGLGIATWTAALLVLATIIIGGYVAGTEGMGTLDAPAGGAHVACGTEFPGCGGSFLPFGRDSMVDAQLTHRVLMFLATIAVLWFAILALARGIRRWPASTAIVMVLLQVLLGAMNVWYGKHAGLIAAHLTLGTLLWAVVVQAGLTYSMVPDRTDETAPTPEPEPAAT